MGRQRAAEERRPEPESTKPEPGVSLPEALVRDLEDLGLSPYEARVVLALLRLGSANSLQLARLSGVPRTSIYQVVDGLSGKGLATRVPGDRAAVWASPGRDEILERLHASEEERLRRHRERTAQVRDTLAKAFPETPDVELPYVRLLHGAAQVTRTYEQLWAGTTEEVLAFSRPPYAQPKGDVLAPLVAALERGVVVRSLYEAEVVNDPGSRHFRPEIEAYIDAGVDARVVEHLPIKLVIFDGKTALVALSGPVVEVGYPTNLLVEHPGFAEVQVDAFERRWETAVRHVDRSGRKGRL